MKAIRRLSVMTLSSRFFLKGISQNVALYKLGHSPMSGRSSMRGYYAIKYPVLEGHAHVRVVDLRTDAVKKPGPAVLRAMGAAAGSGEVHVTELQKIAADMCGMEDALLVPTATMGNLIAVMVHCSERGDEMIVGDLSHLHMYEQGGSAQVAGVHTTTATTLPDGTFDLEQLESRIRLGYPLTYYCRTRLICLENTHNTQGGRVMPLSFLQDVRALADRYGLSVHMDGARVVNAAVAQGVPLSTILQHTHSVTISLCKVLGSPVGAILAGPRDFITRAKRCCRVLGGSMVKAGVLAAAGKVSLQHSIMMGRLEQDHRNAKIFAQAVHDCDLFTLDLASVETNIVRFYLNGCSWSPSEFCDRMGMVCEKEKAALGQPIQVPMYPFYGNSIRAVWHPMVTAEDTQLAIKKMHFVISQYMEEKPRAIKA
ncbi:putative low-specificity L-threonine aldolase 2 [Solea senegalensis]|uniref:Low-specificity L-threonine aldolase 2 n=2 Tax=Solea senegalensis TaxID=28829 RepID=A0AAV6Q4D5_SOLSE|nr:probable low-specificity L-threonine aldolase 2 [Solea senegalensis]XP_043886847.1 probable low-specificity L-threonine aldolase 2 [Solea senegalensis]KAG7462399.1 putative low-specificity L-threonine aldolase 2 [Solea senegalensis]KAG7481973.1 putative low-specificity L-threonine aldolase 2 [Solea senegalensis]